MRPLFPAILAMQLMATLGDGSQAGAQPCNAPDAPAWITHTGNYVLKYDQLAGYAIKHYGAPESCQGEVTSEFDGMDFGTVRLHFAGGATFEMETQPPEASIATLSDSSGFDDEATLREVLKTYTGGIGLEIDWSDTTSVADGIRRTDTFRDPDDGMNASTRLVFRRDTLISVRVSLAL